MACFKPFVVPTVSMDEDKDYGYIVDYRGLFDSVGQAISVYTSELDMDDFETEDIGTSCFRTDVDAGKKQVR